MLSSPGRKGDERGSHIREDVFSDGDEDEGRVCVSVFVSVSGRQCGRGSVSDG